MYKTKPEEYRHIKGHWLVANVEQSIGWPKKDTIVKFRGYDILLISPSNENYAGAAIQYGGLIKADEAQLVLMNFLSSLAWSREGVIRVPHWIGGSLPQVMGKGPLANVFCEKLSLRYLPAPSDKNACIALALFREGMSLDHVAYKFLSFYKIINLRWRSPQDQKKWISEKLNLIENHEAKKRLNELKQSESEIANYLYVSGRCAVAHAGIDPYIDPENVEDSRRLYADLPIIKELAKIMIEQEYGIKTMRTIYEEHLYELEGFRDLLGSKLVDRLKQKPFLCDVEIPKLPRLSLRIHDHEIFPALEGLNPEVQQVINGQVILACQSDDKLFQVLLVLNFADERLQIDPEGGFYLRDDGSTKVMERAASIWRFKRAYYANGELEVWDCNKNLILGYCDPFIPTNIDLTTTLGNFERFTEQCAMEADRRRQENKNARGVGE